MEPVAGAGRRLEAELHDGTHIDLRVLGEGPAILLTVRSEPYDEQTAAGMRQWGADPDYGPTLVHGLADRYTVIAADYEGHRLTHPAPRTLTPSNVARDLLAVADAAGAARFACYGYSWLAVSALQLAVRTDRLDALVMGGYPPMGGPYEAMLAVTRIAHDMAQAGGQDVDETSTEIAPGDWDAVGVQADPDQTGQFVTLYEELQDFDDIAAARALTVPRLCFAGELDTIDYGPRWGNARVVIADAIREHRQELEASGWVVELLPGLDHMTAMHGEIVLPLLRRWLATTRQVGADA